MLSDILVETIEEIKKARRRKMYSDPICQIFLKALQRDMRRVVLLLDTPPPDYPEKKA